MRHTFRLFFPTAFFCLLFYCVHAEETRLLSFEPDELTGINVKLSVPGSSGTRGIVTGIPEIGKITINKSFKVGNELLILGSSTYSGEAVIKSTDGTTSTATITKSVKTIAIGDSFFTSAKTEDTLTGTVSFKIIDRSNWNIPKGNASHGEYAMGLSRVATPTERPLRGFTPIPAADPEPWLYYGMFQNGTQILNTCGIFRGLFPFNWSGYNILRVDVFAMDVNQVIQIAIEDEIVGPMVIRNFQVTPGSWVTLEYDLNQAVLERNIDLSRMTGLHIAVREAPGKKERSEICCLMDNIRLATTGTTPSLPIVRDLSSMELPPYFRHNTTPRAETMPPGNAERSQIQLDTPRIIAAKPEISMYQAGFISAYDNNNLIAGYVCDGVVQTVSTSNGGATWTGLLGEANPTVIPTTIYTDHQSGRGEVIGERGDVLFLASNCVGGATAGMRIHAYTFKFDGSLWTKNCRLVDSDPRHCVATHTAVKTPDGRLWTSYSIATRLATRGINVHFSDDEGVCWKPARENTAGLIPWTLLQPENPTGMYPGTWYYYVSMESNTLVKWGNSVACIIQTEGVRTGRQRDNPLVWMRLEGDRWTEPETIPTPPKNIYYYVSTYPKVRAVSPRNNELFVISSHYDGVFHYKNGTWTHEAPDIPFNSNLCIAGKENVVAIGAVHPQNDYKKYPVIFRAWQYCKNEESWSAPTDVAVENQPLIYGGSTRIPAFNTPASSPPNFVPLIWCANDTSSSIPSIKFVRIPVDTTLTGVSTEVSPTTCLDIKPKAFPNPFSTSINMITSQKSLVQIFSADGRCVWKSSSGNGKLKWDSEGHPQGIYFLKVKTASLTNTIKLIKL